MALPSISDTFKAITSQVATDLTRPVYFMQGHLPEIVDVLASMTQAREEAEKKYPLVALLRDIEEDMRYCASDVHTSFDAVLLILNITKREYRADERETNSFKALLHPICEKLIARVQTSHLFEQGRDFEIKRIDKYYWGREQFAAQLSDYVDCIEVKLSGLKIRNKIC